ncbi:Uncharacterised protein [Legionella longbeachae]|nr:Uncharacterised protein [Legionella longbeachae]
MSLKQSIRLNITQRTIFVTPHVIWAFAGDLVTLGIMWGGSWVKSHQDKILTGKKNLKYSFSLADVTSFMVTNQ